MSKIIQKSCETFWIENLFIYFFCTRYYFSKDKMTGVDVNATHAGGHPGSCCHEPDAFIPITIETAKQRWCLGSMGRVSTDSHTFKTKETFLQLKDDLQCLFLLPECLKFWDYRHVNWYIQCQGANHRLHTNWTRMLGAELHPILHAQFWRCKRTRNWFFFHLTTFGNFICLNRTEINYRKLIFIIV